MNKTNRMLLGGILIFVIAVILAITLSGFLYEAIMTKSKYVSCSDFYKITDKYQSPSGFYLSVESGGNVYSIPVDATQYKLFRVGGYVREAGFIVRWRLSPVNLTVVNESVSGMRDSCEVQP